MDQRPTFALKRGRFWDDTSKIAWILGILSHLWNKPDSKGDFFSALLGKHQKQIKNFGVKRCGLFGSFVRGEHSPQSDINILVEFESGGKTFDNFMSLVFLLEDLFGRKVELITVESLSPYIGPHILREVEYVAFSA